MEKVFQMFFTLWKGIFESGQAAMENKIVFGIVVTAVTVIAILLPFCVGYVFVVNKKRIIAFILVPIINFMIWLSIEFGLGAEGINAIRAIVEGVVIGLVLSLLEIPIAILLNKKEEKTQKKEKKRKR